MGDKTTFDQKNVQNFVTSGNKSIQRIIPYLWYDTQAVEAAKWYVSLFEHSAITDINIMHDTPSGDVDMVDFQLAGLSMAAISAGPYFALNTAISLMVYCPSAAEVDRLYAALSDGGTDLMPLGEYPFSKRYAWIQDKYGLNWQFFLSDNSETPLHIRPSMLFSADVCGKAEEAMDFYQSVFPHAEKVTVSRYGEDDERDLRAQINYAEFNVEGLQMVMMDHGMGGEDSFSEAFSLMLMCDDQEEIDRYWERLSFVPEAEQCGWVKDKFGVSWQIVPYNMHDYMKGSTEEVARITAAILSMKKFDLAALDQVRTNGVNHSNI